MVLVFWVLCNVGSFLLMCKDFLEEFGEVKVEDAVFFGFMSMFGPFSLMSALAIFIMGYWGRLECSNRVLWKKKDK